MSVFNKKNQWIKAIVWLIVPLGFVCVFCVYPAISAIAKSFTEWSASGQTKFVLFDNYKAIFSDGVFWKSCLNMAIIVVFGMITSNVATLFLAELLFNMTEKKVAAIYRYLFLIPSLVPGMVTVLLWKNVILAGTEEGVVNGILAVFGVKPVPWYFSEKWSKFSMIMTNFPWVGGISFLIYLSGLQAIPDSCLEASKLDGVTTAKRIFYIDLPLLAGQIKYFFVVGLVSGVQNFDFQLIVTNGGPNNSTIVPGYILYMKTYGYSKLGEASAIGVTLFLLTFALTTIAGKISRKKTEDNI